MPLKAICSRYDNKVFDASQVIFSLKRYIRKGSFKHQDFLPVSTNGKYIFDGKTKMEPELFFQQNKNHKIFLVLTDKEMKLIYRKSFLSNVDVISLESKFPVFPDIKYIGSLEKSYNLLVRNVKSLRSFGVKGLSIGSHLNNDIRKLFMRKVPRKSSLDIAFAHAYAPPFQEVFKFNECREGRKVIALDFNSMYASCMSGSFLAPESMKYEVINMLYSGEPLNPGLYLVELINPLSDFIKNNHPFRYCLRGTYFPFELNEYDSVVIQLFGFEIEYYYSFFEKVFIRDAILSSKEINHPFHHEALRLFKLRKRAKVSSNKTLERLYKMKIAMLHSFTNPNKDKYLVFESAALLKTFIVNYYNIDEGDAFLTMKKLVKKGVIRVRCSDGEFGLFYKEIDNDESLYSLSAQIVSKARLKLFKLIHEFHTFPGLEICYVNSDSIHISIPSCLEMNFFDSFSQLIGDELGQLKVQSIAEKAFWFDVGRYFFISNGDVVFYKNTGFNHKGGVNPFVKYHSYLRTHESSSFRYMSRKKITVYSTFTYLKRLNISVDIDKEGTNDFSRFPLDEIFSYDSAKISLLREKVKSRRLKIDAYNYLENRYRK